MKAICPCPRCPLAAGRWPLATACSLSCPLSWNHIHLATGTGRLVFLYLVHLLPPPTPCPLFRCTRWKRSINPICRAGVGYERGGLVAALGTSTLYLIQSMRLTKCHSRTQMSGALFSHPSFCNPSSSLSTRPFFRSSSFSSSFFSSTLILEAFNDDVFLLPVLVPPALLLSPVARGGKATNHLTCFNPYTPPREKSSPVSTPPRSLFYFYFHG